MLTASRRRSPRFLRLARARPGTPSRVQLSFGTAAVDVVLPDVRAVTAGESAPHPFLKWAGGKRQLLPQLLPRVLPRIQSGFHEPFIGGGALFFELSGLGVLPARVTLSDANPNLVECYTMVRDQLYALVEHLREHQARHGEGYFYAVRGAIPTEPVERAARLIYLNKTCFNGLYRENRKGRFNVPFGKYLNPAILDQQNLVATSRALAGVELSVADFATVRDRAQRGDFVYFDPPYVPVSTTASFTAYAKAGFGPADQVRLRDVVVELAGGGVHFLLSNSMTPSVRELYGAFDIATVHASRSVNRNADGRGKVEEALVSNIVIS